MSDAQTLLEEAKRALRERLAREEAMKRAANVATNLTMKGFGTAPGKWDWEGSQLKVLEPKPARPAPAPTEKEEEELQTWELYYCDNCCEWLDEDDYTAGVAMAFPTEDVVADDHHNYILIDSNSSSRDMCWWRCSNECFHLDEEDPCAETRYVCPSCENHYETEGEARECCV